MSDRVLVTGGLGYVGGRVSLALAEEGRWKLRLTTRRPDHASSRFAGIADIAGWDLQSDNSLDQVCRGVRTIVHLAAQNEIDAMKARDQALLINGLGTLKLLEAAQRAGVERFIYFSTAHVYGAPLVGTITEQTQTRPVHPYAITHRTAEDFVLAARDEGAIQGIVVRLSNGIGYPAEAQVNRWTLIANDLCRQAVSSKELVLRSHGCQWRDFITLADVGRAVIHLLSLPDEKCADGLFNLGGESALRIIDIAEKIAGRCERVLGFRPPIDRPNPPVGETFPSIDYRIDKLKATDFVLKGNIDDEIDATLKLCQTAFG
jgi:UDP-glucose 4-epimerase